MRLTQRTTVEQVHYVRQNNLTMGLGSHYNYQSISYRSQFAFERHIQIAFGLKITIDPELLQNTHNNGCYLSNLVNDYQKKKLVPKVNAYIDVKLL